MPSTTLRLQFWPVMVCVSVRAFEYVYAQVQYVPGAEHSAERIYQEVQKYKHDNATTEITSDKSINQKYFVL